MSSKKQVTVDQFKAWLEGIEDMQTRDWHPDKNQWKKIRAKIRQLIESDFGSSAPKPNTVPSNMDNLEQGGGHYNTFDAPVPVSNFERVQVDSAVPSSLAPAPRATSERGDVNSPDVVTPDIDTSSGEYVSPFK